MEKLTKKLSENILDKFSMDFLRSQVLKNAYGNDDTVIAALDPRVLLAWYLFFGLVPWFVNDIPFLLGCFLLVMATTILARVAGLVLFLFALGVFSQTGYLFLVTLLFGGDASAITPLLVLTLKVACRSASGWTVREEAAWAEAMTTGASPCKIRERTPSRCCSYSPETLSIWR